MLRNRNSLVMIKCRYSILFYTLVDHRTTERCFIEYLHIFEQNPSNFSSISQGNHRNIPNNHYNHSRIVGCQSVQRVLSDIFIKNVCWLVFEKSWLVFETWMCRSIILGRKTSLIHCHINYMPSTYTFYIGFIWNKLFLFI